MKFSVVAPFFVFFISSSSLFVGCKSRSSSNIKNIDDFDFNYGFVQEIVPFNRLPINVIERDREIFRKNSWPMPDKLQPVQAYKGVEYGLRLIDSTELAKYVRPGDIAVDYSPIDDPTKLVLESKLYQARLGMEGIKPEADDIGVGHLILVGLGERGMNHAKLVVERDGDLCHIDSPDVMSDCKWEGFTHFFRVETAEETVKRVLEMAKVIGSKPAPYAYDAFLFTDIYVRGVSPLVNQMAKLRSQESQSFSPLYCSELPFTLYSLAQGKSLFNTNFNMIDFAKQISELRNEPRFSFYVSDELMQQSLSAFVQQASTVPESVRPMLTSGIKQLLSDGYVGSSMRYLVKKYYPSLVLPHHFMTAAMTPQTVPGTRIVYIGSLELPSVKKDRKYFSTMIYATGKAGVENYLEKVKEWWKTPVKKEESSELLLNGNEKLDVEPNYLEPQYEN
jgi:hypothetical protein